MLNSVYVETPPAAPTIYSNGGKSNPAPKATAKTAATAKTKTTETDSRTASAVFGMMALPSGDRIAFFAVIIFGSGSLG